MTTGITVWSCGGCGQGVFPARVACPRCHTRQFTSQIVRRARIEEVTDVDAGSVRLATLRTEDGVALVGRLYTDDAPGCWLVLCRRPGVAGTAHVPDLSDSSGERTH